MVGSCRDMSSFRQPNEWPLLRQTREQDACPPPACSLAHVVGTLKALELPPSQLATSFTTHPVPALHDDDARVTDEELRLLLMPAPPIKKADADNSFWYRNAFLLAVSIFDTVMLLRFPHEIYRTFHIDPGATDLARYLTMVGWSGIGITLVYAYSYLRDWQFERVSLICFAVLLTNYGHDFFYFSGLNVPLQPMVVVVAVLRLMALVCMLINAIQAKKAPPAHRRLLPKLKYK